MQSNENLLLSKAKEPDAKLICRFISLGMRSGYDECKSFYTKRGIAQSSPVAVMVCFSINALGTWEKRRECCVTFRTDGMYIQQDLVSSYLPMCDC